MNRLDIIRELTLNGEKLNQAWNEFNGGQAPAKTEVGEWRQSMPKILDGQTLVELLRLDRRELDAIELYNKRKAKGKGDDIESLRIIKECAVKRIEIFKKARNL